MHWIVSQMRPGGGDMGGGVAQVVDKITKDALKLYYTDKETAITVAKDLASKNPTIQFAVFEPIALFECLAPPPPKVIEKKINDRGEIVISGSGS